MRWISVSLVFVVAVVLAACAGGGDGGKSSATGEELFAANCARCHGDGATGTGQGPPLVDQVYEPSHHSDDAFRSAVARGVQPHHWDFGPMPPIPSIDGDEIEAIISYVRGLQREAGIR